VASQDASGIAPQRLARAFWPPGLTRKGLGGRLLMIVLIGTMSFYVLYPLFLILLNSFNIAPIGYPEVYGLQAWQEAFSDSTIIASLWNTIRVAVVLLAISFPLSVFLAWLLGRTNLPFARGFEFFFWISFLMPTLATTFGWITLLDPTAGLINKVLAQLPFMDGIRFNIYSFGGIIWAHLMANGLSTKVMLLTPAFRRMDATLEEAGRISGANTLGTMRKILVPVMTPILVVVFLLALVRMFATFEIELLLGAPWGFYVYSTKIVDLARQVPPLLNHSAALGSITLLFLAAFIPLQRWLITRRHFTTVTGQFRPKLVDLGLWKIPAAIFVATVVGFLVVVPILSTVGSSFMVHFGAFNLPKTWTLEYWVESLNNPDLIRALKNTLIIATSAAVLGPMLFSLIAYILVRTRLGGRSVLDAICWIPSAIPGVLAGLGILWLTLGTPVLRPLYGSLTLLILVSMLGGLTLSTQILKANFIQMGKDLEEAARVSGAGFWRTYFKVVLPVMAQTMILVAIIKFMFAAEHTSAIILLATSHTMTLSLLTLEQVSYGYYEQASVSIMIIVVFTVGFGLLGRLCGLKVGMPAH
jgi:iron(III) transport system permease protein